MTTLKPTTRYEIADMISDELETIMPNMSDGDAYCLRIKTSTKIKDVMKEIEESFNEHSFMYQHWLRYMGDNTYDWEISYNEEPQLLHGCRDDRPVPGTVTINGDAFAGGEAHELADFIHGKLETLADGMEDGDHCELTIKSSVDICDILHPMNYTFSRKSWMYSHMMWSSQDKLTHTWRMSYSDEPQMSFNLDDTEPVHSVVTIDRL
jgi:hypothetical protein